ncbi:hypothetical protein OF83DRAFT_97136, partial [Amylostereum chailletii]
PSSAFLPPVFTHSFQVCSCSAYTHPSAYVLQRNDARPSLTLNSARPSNALSAQRGLRCSRWHRHRHPCPVKRTVLDLAASATHARQCTLRILHVQYPRDLPKTAVRGRTLGFSPSLEPAHSPRPSCAPRSQHSPCPPSAPLATSPLISPGALPPPPIFAVTTPSPSPPPPPSLAPSAASPRLISRASATPTPTRTPVSHETPSPSITPATPAPRPPPPTAIASDPPHRNSARSQRKQKIAGATAGPDPRPLLPPPALLADLEQSRSMLETSLSAPMTPFWRTSPSP